MCCVMCAVSRFLVPNYGSGDSVAYSMKSEECSAADAIEIYSDMVRVLCVQ